MIAGDEMRISHRWTQIDTDKFGHRESVKKEPELIEWPAEPRFVSLEYAHKPPGSMPSFSYPCLSVFIRG
jgi:hypothetical protein